MRERRPTDFQQQNSRRLWFVVSFLVGLLLVGLALASYLFAVLLTSGGPDVVSSWTKAAECMRDHLLPTAEAMERYRRDNDRYPQRIEEVYPTYLESEDALRCPADPEKQRKGSSFRYTPPGPGERVPRLICPHHPHVVLEARPQGQSRMGRVQWRVVPQPRASSSNETTSSSDN
ncbi:MAG: hypothetical protein QHJ73_01125 [Armatimonadota bacterium]|nr:hypothetical protein [Armatimonadota bacterium]